MNNHSTPLGIITTKLNGTDKEKCKVFISTTTRNLSLFLKNSYSAIGEVLVSLFQKTTFFEFQVACKFFPLCDPTGTTKKNFGALAALEVGSQGPRFLGWTLIKKIFFFDFFDFFFSQKFRKNLLISKIYKTWVKDFRKWAKNVKIC